jgi:HK97 family phage portal protein
VNDPDGFMTEAPGDLWWIGLHSYWQQRVPASVTRATAIIINPLVRMPWNVHTPAGDTLHPEDDGYPTWLRDPMLLNGSSGGANSGRFPMLDRMDRFDFWARWFRDALWHGTGVLAFEPDSDRRPLAGSLHLIDPTRLYRGDDPDDPWALMTRAGLRRVSSETGTVEGTGIRLTTLRHSLPGGVFGRHRAQLELANQINAYAADTFNTGTPSGVLTTDQPITQPQADVARDEWETTQKRRRIAVLGNGAKYQQVVLSPLDSELVAMARLSNEQVAHMFELPAWSLDASTNSMTYTNAQDNRQEMVDGPLASWSARGEETISALMAWEATMTIDFTKYTKPIDTTTQGVPGATPNPA